MPLIDLRTDLKSLSYNGNGPYIQKDINNPGPPAAGFVQARVDDTSRILRLLGDRGVVFASKQALLLAGTKGLGAIPQAAGILANIVAQVPVNGTGTHFLPIGRNLYYTGVDNASSRALAGREIGAASGNPFARPSRILDRTSAYRRASFVSTLNQEIDNTRDGNSNYTSAILAVTDSKTITINTFNQQDSLDKKFGFSEKGKADTVNKLDIGQGDSFKDLVPVIFKLSGNDKSILIFRGLLQNINDNFNGNWNTVNYVGRMEQFFNYTGFTRTLSFQLVIPIFSVEEQPIVYNKVNSLVSHTAPTYQSGSDLPQGNITNMTLGNYIKSNGILNSVSISISNEVPWSNSSPGEYLGQETRLLPQVLTLSIQFTPIHSKAPQIHLDPHNKGASSPPYINNSSK